MDKKINAFLGKTALFFTLIFWCFVVNAQVIKNQLLVMGIADTVKSKILNETRRISVYLPQAGAGRAFGTTRYPVIYLLDSDDHFPSVSGMVQMLSETNAGTTLPDMIVVGISNLDRTGDLTPTHVTGDTTSGKGEKFTAFIEKELMPHIDSLYPTAPYKILIGHSLGGLTVINTLVNHPDLFNAYVAIDPSMWWDHQHLLNQARSVLKEKNYAGKSLYLGIANTMHGGLDTSSVRKDTTGHALHIRSILLLKDMLQAVRQVNKMNFEYKYYPNDSHASVPLIATYDALRFLFKGYTVPDDFFVRLFSDHPDTTVVKGMFDYYNDLSKKIGYHIDPPIGAMMNMGFAFMDKDPALALHVFTMFVSLYPDNSLPYYCLGEYFKAKNDKVKAIENYRKSLAIQEYGETRYALNMLLSEK